MAEHTGGVALTADNAEELEQALERTVIATQSGTPEQPAPPPPPATIEYTFKATAYLGAGPGEVVADRWNTRWEFLPLTADGRPGDNIAETLYGASVNAKVAPGNYLVRSVAGYVTREWPVVIQENQQAELAAPLNAGVASFSGYFDEASPVGSDAAWEFTDPSGKNLGTEYGSSVAVLLPAGSYRVKLTVGSASAPYEFSVQPGASGEHRVLLGAGVLEVSAVFAEEGPPIEKDTAFEVYKAEKSIDGSRQSLETEYNATSKFKLPAGRYIVSFKSGLAGAEQPFDIAPGQATKLTLVANAGFLAVTAPGAAAIEVLSGAKSITGERKSLWTEYAEAYNAAARQGSYYVRALGPNEAVLGEKLVEVRAGERAEVTFP
jgi:Ca-activated chloride channel family protein